MTHRTSFLSSRRIGGFTLIELMVTVRRTRNHRGYRGALLPRNKFASRVAPMRATPFWTSLGVKNAFSAFQIHTARYRQMWDTRNISRGQLTMVTINLT